LATLSDIKRRIGSVKSTQQITKAMKMVAAAKLRKSQERLLNARPYAIQMQKLMSHVASKHEDSAHPFLQERPVSTVGYVVVTSDRGLCGSFNSNVVRHAKASIDLVNKEKQALLTLVGRKGVEFYSRRGYDISYKYVNILDTLDFQQAVEISSVLQKEYLENTWDKVYVVYNSFKSAGSQEVKMEQFLPIVRTMDEQDLVKMADYIYEPSEVQILSDILPRNLNIQIWKMLLESYASEQGARMVAMDSATENAQEMIHDLTQYYNKVRQATITTEISEIVAGAEALRG